MDIREKALLQLKDLLYSFKNFEEVETTEEDVQALEYAIKELTAQEVPVQEQSIGINSKIESMQWCLTIYSITIIVMLISVLLN